LKKETKMIEDLLKTDGKISNFFGEEKPLITKLPGDASTRKYFRADLKGNSFIIMQRDPFSGEEKSLPFLSVGQHMRDAGVQVPEVFELDAEKGIMVLEDLGDRTLLHKLNCVSDMEIERHLYEKVLDVMVDMQIQCSPKNFESAYAKSFKPFNERFDFEKLMWELNFTVEHFYETYLQRSITDKDKKTLQKGFKSICKELALEPEVFNHRDFHSRNVMLRGKGEEVVLIDFQDARLGPPQYDLVSFLRDSYYQLSEFQVEHLLNYYIARYEAKSEEKINKEHFQRIFDLMTIQRNFKAIGSFASFLNRRGNSTYLKFIGNTFENIRRVLLRYPHLSDLREVLFYYYYF